MYTISTAAIDERVKLKLYTSNKVLEKTKMEAENLRKEKVRSLQDEFDFKRKNNEKKRPFSEERKEGKKPLKKSKSQDLFDSQIASYKAENFIEEALMNIGNEDKDDNAKMMDDNKSRASSRGKRSKGRSSTKSVSKSKRKDKAEGHAQIVEKEENVHFKEVKIDGNFHYVSI